MITVTMPPIADDATVEDVDAHLSGLQGWVRVHGNVDDRASAAPIAGYRVEGLKPLRRRGGDPHDEGFDPTRFTSMTFLFEREDEAMEFHERFS